MIEEMNKLNETEIGGFPRAYLGLSQIGSKCHRYLQYYHYWAFATSHSSRIQRLFDVGHGAEVKMVAALESLGYSFSGSQTEIVGFASHWKGHIDGVVWKGEQVSLVEFKTHNDKSFKDVKKKGVQASKPSHYGQMQSYMGYFLLNRCIYMAYNKNDSEYYLEEVPFDKEYFEDSQRKEKEIILSEVMLPRIGNDSPAWFECKMCSARDVCFKRKPIEENCRTCKFVDVESEGIWRCTNKDSGYKDRTMQPYAQKEGCSHYELNEMFDE